MDPEDELRQVGPGRDARGTSASQLVRRVPPDRATPVELPASSVLESQRRAWRSRPGRGSRRVRARARRRRRARRASSPVTSPSDRDRSGSQAGSPAPARRPRGPSRRRPRGRSPSRSRASRPPVDPGRAAEARSRSPRARAPRSSSASTAGAVLDAAVELQHVRVRRPRPSSSTGRGPAGGRPRRATRRPRARAGGREPGRPPERNRRPSVRPERDEVRGRASPQAKRDLDEPELELVAARGRPWRAMRSGVVTPRRTNQRRPTTSASNSSGARRLEPAHAARTGADERREHTHAVPLDTLSRDHDHVRARPAAARRSSCPSATGRSCRRGGRRREGVGKPERGRAGCRAPPARRRGRG